MALKRLKTKKSKRMTGRQKYKIEKKVREHNRKTLKKAKKQGRKNQKLVQIPNICPFKEQILKDVEEVKKIQEEERQKRLACLSKSRIQHKEKTLQTIVDDADMRGTVHSLMHQDDILDENQYKSEDTKEHSLKQYFKEFKKVLDNSDVVLEVVDARDPLGTRCAEVEHAVRTAPGNKRLVLILNKADLVPRENLNSWLKYFRRSSPVTLFKASTQEQSARLGQRKLHKRTNTDKGMKGSVCFGAELLMSMLGNYCRNRGIKTSIRVGVVGIPNVGKSSIINSLTRGKTCSVGCTPGVTRAMQEVELDSKIKLIDCPGIVFSSSLKGNHSTSAVLKNAQRVADIKDPFSIAENILKRASREHFCKLYDISEYDTFDEFFAKKAARMGKFLKKGVPDVVAAARSLLVDWNSGKIKYCSQPPEVEEATSVHISASIVHEEAREFEVENFEDMETNILQNFHVKDDDVMEIGTYKYESNKAKQETLESKKIITVTETTNKEKKRKLAKKEDKEKVDATMELEGNKRINKNIKDSIKQRKKQHMRNEKNVEKIVGVLDGFSLNTCSDEKYDFDNDYVID